jgi:hypothetical protein
VTAARRRLNGETASRRSPEIPSETELNIPEAWRTWPAAARWARLLQIYLIASY